MIAFPVTLAFIFMLNRISIVLVEPSHPGNIGAVARAMKTMGLMRLILVAPKKFPCAEATERAASADDVLVNARVVDSLQQAIANMQWVIGTSARSRYLEWPQISPEELMGSLDEEMSSGEIAIVFGRENSGLSNDELKYCHKQIVIDTNSDYSSLNLAMAVQIICYELRKKHLNQINSPHIDHDNNLVNMAEMEQFYQHLHTTLEKVAFLDPDKPRLLMTRLRRLFHRAQPNKVELNILRGILSAVDKSQVSTEDKV